MAALRSTARWVRPRIPSSASSTSRAAGIGGLAAAIGLRRIGWDVTVVERASSLEDAGRASHWPPTACGHWMNSASATRYGMPREASTTAALAHRRGSWLARMDGSALEKAVGAPITGIPRSTLHRLLRDSLPDEALLIGSETDSVEQIAPGRVRVGCGETVLDADLVVAADGVGSAVRSRLFPAHPGPVDSGSTVLRTITEQAVDLSTDFELTWGHGAEFGHIAFHDGRAEWHAVLNLPAGTRFADPVDELRRRFHTWHAPIPALLDATRPAAVLHHDVNELRTPLPSYTVGRTALLGDAAHAMTPNLGQGACRALEDAVALAAALATEPTMTAALARYDAERRPRSQAVARAARQAGRMGQRLSHPLAVTLRNTAMRLTPSRAATRMILRHHAWAPPQLS
ncbi:FAD-dependent monooxygenase [Streptomyces sp. NPDC001658]